MQCPVIVSMLIRTRMGSICLQIGILLVCSWSLWGVSFNPNDLNAQMFKIENSKFLQNPVLLMSNLYESGFINTASHDSSPELLNLETCQLWQEGRKALPSKLMFYLWLNVMEWTLSTFKYIFFFFFPGDTSKQFSVSLQFSGGGGISCGIVYLQCISTSIPNNASKNLASEKLAGWVTSFWLFLSVLECKPYFPIFWNPA